MDHDDRVALAFVERVHGQPVGHHRIVRDVVVALVGVVDLFAGLLGGGVRRFGGVGFVDRGVVWIGLATNGKGEQEGNGVSHRKSLLGQAWLTHRAEQRRF